AARQDKSAKLEPAKSVSGSFVFTFPRRSAAGRWTLDHVFLADAVGNTTILNEDGIASLGLARTLEVISVEDREPPRLVSLSLAPDAIDTSQKPAEVELKFRATDDLAGVQSLQAVFE